MFNGYTSLRQWTSFYCATKSVISCLSHFWEDISSIWYRVFKKHILFQLRRFASDRNQKGFNLILRRWNRGHRKDIFLLFDPGGINTFIEFILLFVFIIFSWFLTIFLNFLKIAMWLVVAMNDCKVEFTRSLLFLLCTLVTRLSFRHHNNYGALQLHLEFTHK